MTRLWVALLGMSLTLGCNSSGLPKTYPARGRVLYKNGQPMKGGSVQFTPTDDSGLQAVGTIGEDGGFSLATVRDRARTDGAPEGDYRVMVLLPLQGEHRGVPPISLPGTYKVEAKDNQFTITLDAPPP